MVYLISYDLKAPQKNYAAVTQAIEKLGGRRVLLSQYLLESNDTHGNIRDIVRRAADADDKILVCECHGNAAWTKLLLDDAAVKTIFNRARN